MKRIDLNELMEYLDVISYLDYKSIPYSFEGKNVSSGWIGINCPYCSDPSDHLGINLSSKIYSCFRCGQKGGFINLIAELENCSFGRAIHIASEFTTLDIPIVFEKDEYADRCKLPPETIEDFPDRFRNYLINRNFDPDLIIDKYGIKATLPVGNYANRIIIPYYIHGETITFSARTIRNAEPKYLHCPIGKSVRHVNSTVYNIDNIDDTIIIVEGVTDVWRIGGSCGCLSGIKFTEQQISLLLKMKLKKCFIMFDSEAGSEARQLAYRLNPFIKHVEVLELDEGDPAELNDNEVQKLRNELL